MLDAFEYLRASIFFSLWIKFHGVVLLVPIRYRQGPSTRQGFLCFFLRSAWTPSSVHFPTHLIGFPGILFCSPSRVNWGYLRRFQPTRVPLGFLVNGIFSLPQPCTHKIPIARVWQIRITGTLEKKSILSDLKSSLVPPLGVLESPEPLGSHLSSSSERWTKK